MTAAILSGCSLRRLVQRAGMCHRVLERCCLSTSSLAAQMHASLQQFTDDETMMRDTGICHTAVKIMIKVNGKHQILGTHIRQTL